MAIEDIYNLFAEMRDISEKQLLLARGIVNDPERSEEMLGLLERRQEIMDRIDLLSVENPDYWGFIVNSNEHEEIIGITNHIQEYDRQSRQLIESVRKQVSNKLSNAHNNIKAYDAYLPNEICTEGWFFDRKK